MLEGLPTQQQHISPPLEYHISLPQFLFPITDILHHLQPSGSSHSFVNEAFVLNNRLKISYLLRAIPLRMFNGSTTSTIDRMCHLPIMFSTSESHMMDLFITKLDEEYLVVLGYNWLTQHNPSIDWVEMKITFQDPRKGKPPEKPPSPTPEAIDIHLVSERTMKKLSVRVQPCALDSALFRCISKALPCTLTHCILDSTCYTTLHCPLHL